MSDYVETFGSGAVAGAVFTAGGGFLLMFIFALAHVAIPGLNKLIGRILSVVFGRYFGFWALGMHVAAVFVLSFAPSVTPPGAGRNGVVAGSLGVLAIYWALRLGRGSSGAPPDPAQLGGHPRQQARGVDDGRYNGEWAWRSGRPRGVGEYAFRLRNGVGICTVTNASSYFGPGQTILVIEEFNRNDIRGRQMFTDGRWYPVRLRLSGSGLLKMNSGSERWDMTKVG
ncbi:hypothetical protein [Micromonospora sp. NBC_01796]|uniref:hypothetical protein n=1 Tax=Micromonospora sp. NBC_01796 TaxID=2975987 RepID=UPI002DD84DC0|nr:hypothetical protein [Micromonospora sp. NBC_01796]WSA83202.1 hypothetical protein OIE47_22625 [Micromonospora sp. NBC_01796]